MFEKFPDLSTMNPYLWVLHHVTQIQAPRSVQKSEIQPSLTNTNDNPNNIFDEALPANFDPDLATQKIS